MTQEYVYPSRSVHITRENLGKKAKLRPSKGYNPHGVSFSPTVKRALEGVPYFYNVAGKSRAKRKDWAERKKWANKKSIWNVYTPIRKRRAIIPKTIDDFERTGERRVLSKVNAKLIGRIKVRVGRNRWEYRWL